MTAILLSLGSAVTFGAADFLGGIASRKGTVLPVTLTSQAVGFLLILATMPFLSGELSGAAIGWGLVAGVGGSVGLLTYFRALSMGAMGVTAPVSSLVGAMVPLTVGLGLGERPGSTASIGIVVGIAAGLVVSRPSRTPTTTPDHSASETPPEADGARQALLIASFAGVMFGLFFVALDQAPSQSGLWPLVGARVMGLAIVGGATATRGGTRPSRDVIGIAAVSGLLDMVANLLFLFATRQGLLVLTSVITGLYPVGVVILAWVFLKERLGQFQLAGVAMALGATVLIAL